VQDPTPTPAGFNIDTTAVGDTVTFEPTAGTTSGEFVNTAAYTLVDPLPGGVGGGKLSGRLTIPLLPVDTNTFFRIGVANLTTFDASALDFVIEHGVPFDPASLFLDDDAIYFFEFEVGPDLKATIWPVGTVKPTTPNYNPTGSQTGSPDFVYAAVEFQSDPVSPQTFPYTFMVDQLAWCYQPDQPVAYSGKMYGPIEIATADGTTNEFALPIYPGTGYVPGTVSGYVNGILQPVSDVDPTPPAQTFGFGPDPDAGDVIDATWLVP
jgi:hypothetical protein